MGGSETGSTSTRVLTLVAGLPFTTSSMAAVETSSPEFGFSGISFNRMRQQAGLAKISVYENGYLRAGFRWLALRMVQ